MACIDCPPCTTLTRKGPQCWDALFYILLEGFENDGSTVGNYKAWVTITKGNGQEYISPIYIDDQGVITFSELDWWGNFTTMPDNFLNPESGPITIKFFSQADMNQLDFINPNDGLTLINCIHIEYGE